MKVTRTINTARLSILHDAKRLEQRELPKLRTEAGQAIEREDGATLRIATRRILELERAVKVLHQRAGQLLVDSTVVQAQASDVAIARTMLRAGRALHAACGAEHVNSRAMRAAMRQYRVDMVELSNVNGGVRGAMDASNETFLRHSPDTQPGGKAEADALPPALVMRAYESDGDERVCAGDEHGRGGGGPLIGGRGFTVHEHYITEREVEERMESMRERVQLDALVHKSTPTASESGTAASTGSNGQGGDGHDGGGGQSEHHPLLPTVPRDDLARRLAALRGE